GVVPMRDGKLQGKNVFNRQELLWLQDKFPEHMKKQGFELKRGERGSDRKHIETAKFKKQTLEKEIDFLEKNLAVKKDEWTRSEEHTSELQSRFDLVCRLLLEKKQCNEALGQT